MYIDTHAHLYKEYYDDLDNIIVLAKEKGVATIVTSGVDQKTNKETLELASRYSNIYGNIGIHPECVDSYTKQDLDFIEANIVNLKIIAIGEIGLDYHYDNYDKNKQMNLFELQLAIAEKHSIPVVVHSRCAFKDTYEALCKYKVDGVIHSFSGTIEEAKKFIDRGFKLGLNGIVTFKNSDIISIVKKLGINNFLLETDSPYLSPEPLRGKKNDPSNITYIGDYLCKELDISKGQLQDIMTDNFYKQFPRAKR